MEHIIRCFTTLEQWRPTALPFGLSLKELDPANIFIICTGDSNLKLVKEGYSWRDVRQNSTCTAGVADQIPVGSRYEVKIRINRRALKWLHCDSNKGEQDKSAMALLGSSSTFTQALTWHINNINMLMSFPNNYNTVFQRFVTLKAILYISKKIFWTCFRWKTLTQMNSII